MMDTKFFKQNNGELAYDDRGKGPLVIGVSGFGDLPSESRTSGTYRQFDVCRRGGMGCG
jgi:hypothetical protein